MYLKAIIVLTTLLSSFAREEDVIHLTDSDFYSAMAKFQTTLVMFYAQSCADCERLMPEFHKAAEDLLLNDPPITLVKIECSDTGSGTCMQYEVSKNYPVLKIFRHGEFVRDYDDGLRSAEGIVQHMKAQAIPSSQELASVDELKDFLNSAQDASFVGFFEGEAEMKKVFFRVADNLQGTVRFAHSSCEEVLEQQGIADGIVFFRPLHLLNKFEEDSVVYRGEVLAAKFDSFVRENLHGLVDHRRIDNKDDFMTPIVIAYYNIDYTRNPKITNYWRNRVLKVAKEYKDKINFAISSKDDFQDELKEFGTDFVDGKKPFVVARKSDKETFIMEGDFDVATLDKFVRGILQGNLKPYVKSEPIPENNDGPVKIAVAKNFDEVVNNNGKDTLIEFYAPWCAHCKMLAATYEQLAEEMMDEEVEIVKMDTTANEVPQVYSFSGVPTLYWAAKYSKDKPVKYEGGRTLEDFIKYIAEHATEELKGYDRKGKPIKTEL